MSAANAAARKRRAPQQGADLPNNRPAMPQQSNMQQGQTPTSSGLTLPQVISVIDKRLVNLETFMKETKDSVSST